MKQQTMWLKQMVWFAWGIMIGFTAFTIARASVPKGRITDDTGIYQRVSEIQTPKSDLKRILKSDEEIANLLNSEQKPKYRESLPALNAHARLKAPIQRLSQQQYHYVGAKKTH